MTNGGSIVGLDFDATVAWPAYNWMGFAKAALESANRYLARELGPQGIRVNLVAAGPIKTMAAKSIPGFTQFEDVWDDRAPLGWDVEARARRLRADPPVPHASYLLLHLLQSFGPFLPPCSFYCFSLLNYSPGKTQT